MQGKIQKSEYMFRNFTKFLKSKFVWGNVLAAVVLFVIVLFLLSLWLKSYTHHNEKVEVPDLTGNYIEEAEITLQNLGLKYEIIDSVYLRTLKPGEIAEQTPAPHTYVKKNRTIYITTNRRTRISKTIPIDNLVEISPRQAQSSLRNLGFNADSIQYIPAEHNSTINILYNGEPVTAYTKIPDGASLIIIAGENINESVPAPNYIGMTYNGLRNMFTDINSMNQRINIIYDTTPTSETDRQYYKVYKQTPEANSIVTEGTIINVYMSKSKKTNTEEFF